MRVPLVDLVSQHREIQERMDAALLDVAASGKYILGPNCTAFEEEMARAHGVKHAIGVASGTDALKIALEAMGVGAGDEVITTPFTFVATAEVVMQLGARVVFVDIDPGTFNMDATQVEAKISGRTKAIVPIHLFGQLAEMEPIVDIARRHQVGIVEDAAQAVRTSRNGKFPGQFGDAATLSFFPTKNLGALGDGGMILTNDDALREASVSLRMHGMAAQSYMYTHVGYASRLDEIQAAALRVKNEFLTEWNHRRQRNAALYCDVLRDTDASLPSTLPGNEHTYHQFTIRHPRRDDLRAWLREREVDSAIYYPLCLHEQSAYLPLGYHSGDFPVAEQAAREVVSLPIQAHLTEDQVRFAADSVVEFCRQPVVA